MNKFLDNVFIFIVAIALVVNGMWVYFFVFKGDKGFETTLTTVSADLSKVKNVDETKTYPIQVNVYSNENKNGLKTVEINTTSYTSAEMESYTSSGLQLINPTWKLEKFNVSRQLFAEKYAYAYRPEVKAYNTSDGVAYRATNALSRNDQVIFNIGEDVFAFKVRSYFEENDPLNVKTDRLVKFDQLLWAEYFYDYDWAMLTKKLQEFVETLNYGDFEISLVDLADYVVLQKYDAETKQFKRLNNYDNYRNYFTIKVHHDKNGMTDCEQSLFKMVNYDPYYFGQAEASDYWKAVAEYELDLNKDFDVRETDSGKYITIKHDVAERLNKYSNIKVALNINLDNYDIAGIDNYGLYGFKIDTINITSSTAKEFSFLARSLELSGLKTINKTGNVTLYFVDKAGFGGDING